jgi:hypothetical protein
MISTDMRQLGGAMSKRGGRAAFSSVFSPVG